jgi:glutamine amidotransferase
MIAVANYGIGNLRSVLNALAAIGAQHELVSDAGRLTAFDKIILPGVGAFGACVRALEERDFKRAILSHAQSGKPLLGICVGMQMLADRGEEFGVRDGLGLIPGTVVQIPRSNETLRLPHVGWNALKVTKACPMMDGLAADTSAYFVHSFHFAAADAGDVSAVVEYGSTVTAAVSRGNVFGVQFHPEKSQMVGLQVLRNFAAL